LETVPFTTVEDLFHTSKLASLDLPYRFKAGGKGKMPAPVAHSHRNTTKVTHKPFKARKATKGALKEILKGKSCDMG
jgi:hypothetical protein